MTFPGWLPDPKTVAGGYLEIPVRAPGLPANLWVHWARNIDYWAGFPPSLTSGDWHRFPVPMIAPVSTGDTVLAGQASVAISIAHREETGPLGRTDNWGMAVDSVAPLTSPVVGPAWVIFPASFAYLGNCWPAGIWLNIDLLVLRESLIPPVPPPYGTPRRLGRAGQLAHLEADLSQLAHRLATLRERTDELEVAVDIESRSPGARLQSATFGTSSVLPKPPFIQLTRTALPQPPPTTTQPPAPPVSSAESP
jgi:hypothetical protein